MLHAHGRHPAVLFLGGQQTRAFDAAFRRQAKGKQRRGQALPPSGFHRRLDHRLMALMHTVKKTHGHGAALRGHGHGPHLLGHFHSL